MWVKFLNDKYMNPSRGEGHPVANASDSVLWKSICREWDVVSQNVSWNLGNGRHVLFWRDKWLGEYGPLNTLLNPEARVNTLHYTVADMVDSGGNWKWELFAHLLPIHTVMNIAGHIPPMQDTREDSVVWDHSSNGRLSVRTAYMVQEKGGAMDRDPLWRIIWKWKGLERIRVFLWTVGHNAIMTNEVRWRRKMTDNKYCGQCVNVVETVTHALRDCPKARKIWEVFVKTEERDLFFSQIFGITLWYIWKERCNTTFGGDQGNWFGTILAIKRMVEDSKKIQRNGNESPAEAANIGWKYPAEGWIKLNVDGCSKGNPGIAGAGGVIRDHMGTWIGGFARNIGICSSVTAELWAIYEGLKLTWDKGFRKVYLESDSRVVIALFNGESGSKF
uniref:RNase H type-1 domain-containing protein n=1 Tax=Salix viminalis TaxID=40686 RepID=A0A6N2MZS1_SALVM